jgi:hypothetical protein
MEDPGQLGGDLVVGRVPTRAAARRRRGDHHLEPAQKKNAISATMWDELLDVCRQIGASEIDRTSQTLRYCSCHTSVIGCA